jgi:hypothetical protein
VEFTIENAEMKYAIKARYYNTLKPTTPDNKFLRSFLH